MCTMNFIFVIELPTKKNEMYTLTWSLTIPGIYLMKAL